MPAAEITEVKVTWHDERRGAAEYSPPMKKAEVSLFASVPDGADPVAALNYVTRLAQDKVKEMLMGSASPAAMEEEHLPSTSSVSQHQGGSSSASAAADPPRRTRRTAAPIAADEAAAAEAKAAQTAAADKTTSGSATDAQPASQDQTASTQPASSQPSSAGSTEQDEWEAAAPQVVEITDTELNHTCSVTADRVKDPAKVKGVIAKFNPGGDAFDPAKPGGRKFTVNDIPAQQRADFIAQLKALT